MHEVKNGLSGAAFVGSLMYYGWTIEGALIGFGLVVAITIASMFLISRKQVKWKDIENYIEKNHPELEK